MNPHLNKDEGTVRLKTLFYCDACQWIKILKKVFSRKSICSKMKNCRNNFDISQICVLFCILSKLFSPKRKKNSVYFVPHHFHWKCIKHLNHQFDQEECST